MSPRRLALTLACSVAAFGTGATPSLAAPARWVVSAWTVHAKRGGHIDRLHIVLAEAPASSARISVHVAGYRVRSITHAGRVVSVALVPDPAADAGARPRVRVTVGGRTTALVAGDGAPPVLMSASAGTTPRIVVLRWSEPVRNPHGRAASALTLRDAAAASWKAEGVLITDAGREVEVEQAASEPAATEVTYSGPGLVDDAGNQALPASVQVVGATSATKRITSAVRTKKTSSTTGAQSTTTSSTTTTKTTTTSKSTATTSTATTSTATTSTATASTSTTSTSSDGTWNVLENPINPDQLTDLAYCDRSYWLQPWRAYLNTPPASELSDDLGINFNLEGPSAAPDTAAPGVAALLGGDGFHHARIEENWGDVIAYGDPTQLSDPSDFVTELQTLQSNGLRPLILLNANQQAPTPMEAVNLDVAVAAAAGATTIQLTPDTVSSVVPGYTGFSNLSGYSTAAQDIITSITPQGLATLSLPLPVAVGTGDQPGDTLEYQPFAPPENADGTPNAAFESTLSGWLDYVAAVTQTAKQALGGDNFDVEVWNEMNFASNFLDASNYYTTLPADLTGQGDNTQAILDATVEYLRDPANGLMSVGVTDGFASQNPFDVGGDAPSLGLTALSKHPYTGDITDFGAPFSNIRACEPLNALGQPDGTDLYTDNLWVDNFTPTFTDYFPEYYLTAIQTESLIRDIAPITNDVYGVPHGSAVEPPIWVTEQNIDPSQAGLTGMDAEHMQAKATLRELVSFVNLGVQQLDFYAATGTDFGLIDPTTYIDSNGTSGGEVIDSVARMLNWIGPTDINVSRSLTLQSIAQLGDDYQFLGDGTPEHPTLYNRDVLGVFPFQVNDDTFVVPAYVMTRDLDTNYDTSAPATDESRWDLPPESYQLTLGGIDGNTATVTAYDPLNDESVPAQIVASSPTTVTVQVQLTDSPRLLRITD